MKRYGNLYEQIYSMDNLRKAHKNARKGKGWYEEVKEVDANIEVYLKQLQEKLMCRARSIERTIPFFFCNIRIASK